MKNATLELSSRWIFHRRESSSSLQRHLHPFYFHLLPSPLLFSPLVPSSFAPTPAPTVRRLSFRSESHHVVKTPRGKLRFVMSLTRNATDRFLTLQPCAPSFRTTIYFSAASGGRKCYETADETNDAPSLLPSRNRTPTVPILNSTLRSFNSEVVVNNLRLFEINYWYDNDIKINIFDRNS